MFYSFPAPFSSYSSASQTDECLCFWIPEAQPVPWTPENETEITWKVREVQRHRGAVFLAGDTTLFPGHTELAALGTHEQRLLSYVLLFMLLFASLISLLMGYVSMNLQLKPLEISLAQGWQLKRDLIAAGSWSPPPRISGKGKVLSQLSRSAGSQGRNEPQSTALSTNR